MKSQSHHGFSALDFNAQAYIFIRHAAEHYATPRATALINPLAILTALGHFINQGMAEIELFVHRSAPLRIEHFISDIFGFQPMHKDSGGGCPNENNSLEGRAAA